MKTFILNNIDMIKNNGKEYLKMIKFKKKLKNLEMNKSKHKIKKCNILYIR